MVLVVILFLLGFILITKGADIFINCTVDSRKENKYIRDYIRSYNSKFCNNFTRTNSIIICIYSMDHTTMSLGNAVGSIICNTGLILGLVAFISPFKIDKNMFLL